MPETVPPTGWWCYVRAAGACICDVWDGMERAYQLPSDEWGMRKAVHRGRSKSEHAGQSLDLSRPLRKLVKWRYEEDRRSCLAGCWLLNGWGKWDKAGIIGIYPVGSKSPNQAFSMRELIPWSALGTRIEPTTYGCHHTLITPPKTAPTTTTLRRIRRYACGTTMSYIFTHSPTASLFISRASPGNELPYKTP